MISTDLIAAVRDARVGASMASGVVRDLREQFEASIAERLETQRMFSERLRLAEDTLRQAIIAEFLATGNKAPAPGCGVKMIQRIDYDLAKATAWGYIHEMCLSLNKAAFEKVAKVSNLDFVTITEEPQALIATDLDKALGENHA